MSGVKEATQHGSSKASNSLEGTGRTQWRIELNGIYHHEYKSIVLDKSNVRPV